jgi:aminopeptidase N
MGYRLGSSKTGWDVPRRLIYPKGAFILHMVRMMMADRQTGDQKFNAMMRDFATTYSNRTATTEDFKAMVEKHMLPSMNLTQNGKMDWFFNEYVYGTALPTYHFESSFSEPNNGSVRMHIKLTQSGVPKDFMMTVPVYLELANGGIARLGLLGINGNSTYEQDVDLPLQQKPKRAMINYYYDVLSLNN